MAGTEGSSFYNVREIMPLVFVVPVQSLMDLIKLVTGYQYYAGHCPLSEIDLSVGFAPIFR
jgi:hypothetical protein